MWVILALNAEYFTPEGVFNNIETNGNICTY